MQYPYDHRAGLAVKLYLQKKFYLDVAGADAEAACAQSWRTSEVMIKCRDVDGRPQAVLVSSKTIQAMTLLATSRN